ncbi:MAG: hypothetical protein WCK59_00395 [Candidatus Falkowbacteria bacterium]
MTTIAIILFIILCLCISYITIKKRLIPWSGGVMVLMGDDNLVPIDFSERTFVLNDGWKIKGFFLPGALRHSLPDVHVRVEKSVYYRYVEKDGGVYVVLDECLSAENIHSYFILDVTSSSPWKGQYEKERNGWNRYYKNISFEFN